VVLAGDWEFVRQSSGELTYRVLRMHEAQVDLLRVDWGQPGFCREWERDYNAKTRSCGRRGEFIERRYPQ